MNILYTAWQVVPIYFPPPLLPSLPPFLPFSSVISFLTVSQLSLSSLSTAEQMVRNFSAGTPQISNTLEGGKEGGKEGGRGQ